MRSRHHRSHCRALIGAAALLMAVQFAAARPLRAACAGDCNDDQQVAINELIVMVNVALDTAPASQCEAGDVNGDGTITVEEIVAAVGNALAGCPAAFTPTVTLTPTPSVSPSPTGPHASIDLGSATGAPGDTVAITLTLSGGSREVAASVDISFDVTQVTASLNAHGAPDCVINPAIGPATAAGKSLVSSLAPSEPPGAIVRVGIYGFNDTIIPDGLLGTCNFTIVPTAVSGVLALHNKPGAADASGNPLFVTGADGAITVQ